jgi:hypothetical protein
MQNWVSFSSYYTEYLKHVQCCDIRSEEQSNLHPGFFPIQEAQMTTVTNANVHNVNGTFDDCQSLLYLLVTTNFTKKDIVKSVFADKAFNGKCAAPPWCCQFYQLGKDSRSDGVYYFVSYFHLHSLNSNMSSPLVYPCRVLCEDGTTDWQARSCD